MTDYSFYINRYLGSAKEAVLDAASFPFWERKAANEVRNLTFGNINENETIPEVVQCSVCEVAELLYKQEADERNIASETVGGYSVSYRAKASIEKKAEVYVAVSGWLAHTGLMYCGSR